MKAAIATSAVDLNPSAWPALLDTAAQEVFEIMLGCRPQPWQGKARGHDLTAIVGLAGRLCGALTVRCTQHAASLMTSQMLGPGAGESNPENTEHLWDAIGEMCNMIAGNFKNKLPDLADSCLLSVPTVIVGRGYKLRPRTNCRSLEVVFEFAGDPFAVTLDIHL